MKREKLNKPERRDGPDGMVQYRPPHYMADSQEAMNGKREMENYSGAIHCTKGAVSFLRDVQESQYRLACWKRKGEDGIFAKG